ncbi:MAG TPA: carbohydrate ABC transporter permease [Anaerolineales bacterium]|nr:carbohydrate ABC transporter permease [Anaerolineales bacterium]
MNISKYFNINQLKRAPEAVVKQFALLLLSLMTLFPLYFMFTNALKIQDEFFDNLLGLPQNLIFDNFTKILQHEFIGRWFANSIVLTAGSVLITTVIAILAAYAFALMKFPGRDTLFNLITPLMVIPPIVMVIPMFVLFRRMHLVNNLGGPLVIYAGLMLPFTIYLLRNFFITIPNEIQDAALIDGCTDFQVLTKIYLPLSKPAIVTSVIVNAVWVWNELLIALVFLQSEELRTLIVGITTSLQKRFTLDVPALMAGLAVATIPMILLYIIGQNALVRGLVAGHDK